ncbi:MAG TPA: DUF2892 domain-containing protein [bacterium]|nr:DUF2892 domain-containing protein [bacterium]
MTQSDLFRAIVGTMILISVVLTIFVSQWWLAFTVFIGANMLQSAFTHFCPMDTMLARTRLPATRIPRNG